MQHGFSSFLVIHRKRECAVFSGEGNASARCLPAYNSCSSSRVRGTRRRGLSARGSGSDWLWKVVAPPTTSAYWAEIGRINPPARIPPVHATAAWDQFETQKARGLSSLLYSCRAHAKHSAPQEFTSTLFVFSRVGHIQVDKWIVDRFKSSYSSKL